MPMKWSKVSIIIPARNEEKFIRNSIQSILEARYPNKEIIVIDGGSIDRTFEKKPFKKISLKINFAFFLYCF